MNVKDVAGYFNPFSVEFSRAVADFSKIKHTRQKTAVVAAAVFAALLTLPLGGIGGAAAFRFLVERFSQKAVAVQLENFKKPLTESEKADPEPYELREVEIGCAGVDVSSGKQGLFVDVLNAGKYIKDGKEIIIPQASKPLKIVVDHSNYDEEIENLREQIELGGWPAFSVADLTTEEAIAADNRHMKIALNFANEHHAGGGPGIHRDPHTQKLVYDGPSAKAQEESLCQHSDLMVSLTQLEHVLKKSKGSYMVRSFYKEPFDSSTMAYVSQNHLFALKGSGFYDAEYLDEVKPVSFVTSAAPMLSGKIVQLGDQHYNDLRQRIRTNLLAAAHEAVRLKKEHPGEPVELILGAFGCGAFAPVNAWEYAQMVAKIYDEELDAFIGFFDMLTYAVPTFGATDPNHPAVRNHQVFNKVLIEDFK